MYLFQEGFVDDFIEKAAIVAAQKQKNLFSRGLF